MTVVPEHTACAVPVLVHLICLLLQISCTTQLRPLTVMVSPVPPSSQMSPTSPHPLLLSPQPAGYAYELPVSRPMSGSVTASTNSWDAVSV